MKDVDRFIEFLNSKSIKHYTESNTSTKTKLVIIGSIDNIDFDSTTKTVHKHISDMVYSDMILFHPYCTCMFIIFKCGI